MTIDNDQDATLWDEEFLGGGSNTMTDTETGKTYTLAVTNGKLMLTEVS